MELTDMQTEAIEKAKAWYGSKRQVFRLFGYAGTGKTTLAKMLDQELTGGRAQFAAYTGKAANVMREYGADNACTVHRLIYKPLNMGGEVRWQKIPRSALARTNLMILDEVSMIGEKLAKDLLSYGTKLLVLGDPAQLPPVGDGTGYFTTNAEPDVMLTEVHRHALDSRVTRLATTVRQSTSGDHFDIKDELLDDITTDQVMAADQVLAGTNQMRIDWTREIRRQLDRPYGRPVAGDRMVVLANNYQHAVFNGQTFTVLNVDSYGSERWMITCKDDAGDHHTLPCWRLGFRMGRDAEEKVRAHGRKQEVAATFGQVLTVHKAQGSQWPNVLIVNEAHGHHGADPQAWMYTAITRAQEHVDIYGGV